MKKSDVAELLESQRRLKLLIPGFRFNLGFSGKYYHKGIPEEDTGDDYLLGMFIYCIYCILIYSIYVFFL